MNNSILKISELSTDTCNTIIEKLKDFVTLEKFILMESVLQKRTRHITIAVENMFQPHNASACIRTCECFGIQNMNVIEREYSFRPSRDIVLGSAKWLTIKRYTKNIENPHLACINDLKSAGYKIVATSLKPKSKPLQELDINKKSAIFFGTERVGLSPDLLELVDESVYIPMQGFTQSYNVSVSVALCLYELTNQLRKSDINWQLTNDEKSRILLSWLIKAVRNGKMHIKRVLKELNLDPDQLMC